MTDPKAIIDLRTFNGMSLHIDPEDLGDGAAEEQVNITSDKVGQLTVRGGYREVTFEA